MTERRKINEIIVIYEDNGLQASISIPISKLGSKPNYTALFWEDSSIKKVLAPYYSSTDIRSTEHTHKEPTPFGIKKHLTHTDVVATWKLAYENNKLPYMLALTGESSIKVYS